MPKATSSPESDGAVTPAGPAHGPVLAAARLGGPGPVREKGPSPTAHLGRLLLLNAQRRCGRGSQERRLLRLPLDRSCRCSTWLPTGALRGPAAPPGPRRAAGPAVRSSPRSSWGVRARSCLRAAGAPVPGPRQRPPTERAPAPYSRSPETGRLDLQAPHLERGHRALRALSGIVCAHRAPPGRRRPQEERARRSLPRANRPGSWDGARSGPHRHPSLGSWAPERGAQGQEPQVRAQGLGGCGWRREPRKPQLLGTVVTGGACLRNQGFGDMPERLPPTTTHYRASARVLVTPMQFLQTGACPPSEVSASPAREGPAAPRDSPLGGGKWWWWWWGVVLHGDFAPPSSPGPAYSPAGPQREYQSCTFETSQRASV